MTFFVCKCCYCYVAPDDDILLETFIFKYIVCISFGSLPHEFFFRARIHLLLFPSHRPFLCDSESEKKNLCTAFNEVTCNVNERRTRETLLQPKESKESKHTNNEWMNQKKKKNYVDVRRNDLVNYCVSSVTATTAKLAHQLFFPIFFCLFFILLKNARVNFFLPQPPPPTLSCANHILSQSQSVLFIMYLIKIILVEFQLLCESKNMIQSVTLVIQISNV